MQKKSFETILYSAIGVIVMAAIIIAVNVITGAVRQRVDLTREKAYTLSDGTRAILAKLDTPVKVRFYCTQSEASTYYSVQLKGYAKKVEDLLAEYKQAAHGKLIIEKFDPQPDTDAEDSARLDGVDEQLLPTGEKFYLGLAVSQVASDEKQTIAFLAPDRERQLEYDLSAAISRVVTPEKATVGIMSSLPVFGTPSNPMMMQMGRQGQDPWAIVGELKSDFAIKNVEVDTDKIDDDIKVLLVIHPGGITVKGQYAIDQFILRGGKLIAFLDPQSLVDSRGQNPMMGGMPGSGSSLDKLLTAWGLQFDTSKVVADRNFKMELGDAGDQTKDRPTWLMLTPEGINNDDLVLGDLDNIWYFSGGAFTGTPAAGLKETVLLKSTKDSQLVDGMMASFGGEGVLKDFKPSGTEYALAVRLTGKFKTAFPGGKPEEKKEEDQNAADKKPETKPADKPADNSLKESKDENMVILVGDSDMIFDGYTLRRITDSLGRSVGLPMNGNLNFALNAVEQMSGDNNLIAVRSRAAIHRPFTRVKEMQKSAEEKYLVKIKELQENRERTVNRLNELQQQKNQNQRFILSPEQQAEIEKLRKEEGEMGRELRQVDKNLRREVVAMQRKIQWYNVLIMPAIVALTGIALALYKRKRTSAK
jgi:gliding motility-associatede transport system auxiliary component